MKESIFPYPADNEAAQDNHEEKDSVLIVDERGASALLKENGQLQGRLHEAIAQLEQANNELVEQTQAMCRMSQKEQEAAIMMRDMERKNAALSRRLANLEGMRTNLPRPGPPLKAFVELTPRDQNRASKELQAHINKTSEERKIHPAKLSAYMTYRCSYNIYLFTFFLNSNNRNMTLIFMIYWTDIGEIYATFG